MRMMNLMKKGLTIVLSIAVIFSVMPSAGTTKNSALMKVQAAVNIAPTSEQFVDTGLEDGVAFQSVVPVVAAEGKVSDFGELVTRYSYMDESMGRPMDESQGGKGIIYDSETKIYVQSGMELEHIDTYLVVQNSTGAYAKKLVGDEIITAQNVSSELDDFKNCKVWIESIDRNTSKLMARLLENVDVTMTPETIDLGTITAGDALNSCIVKVKNTGAETLNVRYETATTNGFTATLKSSTELAPNGEAEWEIKVNDGIHAGTYDVNLVLRYEKSSQDAYIAVHLKINVLAATSGNCGEEGDNLTWTLDDAGVLTISGTGNMKNYDGYDDTPWYDSTSKIKEIVVNKGVTAIGNQSFNVSGSLIAISLPDGLTRIGASAFKYAAMKKIIIPDSVTDIGDHAFYGCKSLEEVKLPAELSSISDALFDNCSALKSIEIPSSVTSIGEYAFQSCNALEEIVIPENVNYISRVGIGWCLNLKRVIVLNDNISYNDSEGDTVFRGTTTEVILYGNTGSNTQLYAASHSMNFIALKDFDQVTVNDIDDQYYEGTAVTPDVQVYDGESLLSEGTDYTLSYLNNDKAGSATVIVTGKGTYTGQSTTKNFTVIKKQYKVTVSKDENVSVNPSDQLTLDYDASKDYTIKANEGYEISSILVNGEEKKDSLRGGILTISNLNKDVTIVVKTKKIEVVTKPDEPTTPTDETVNWDVIQDKIQTEIDQATDKATVTIDMGDTTEVPGSVIESIKGKDIDVVFDLGNGIK